MQSLVFRVENASPHHLVEVAERPNGLHLVIGMPLEKARRTDLRDHAGGVIYRQQYVRCGKATCAKCPPAGPGHGPYWYGFYWDYRQRTRSFYVGKQLPDGVELLVEQDPPNAVGDPKLSDD